MKSPCVGCWLMVPAVVMCAVGAGALRPRLPVRPARPADPPAAPRAAFDQPVKGSAITLKLVPISGAEGVPPFYMSTTEVPWELYDVFVYQLDAEKGDATPEADAVARPTKPYISMDRGFGHAGWPAISMSAKNAQTFCEWLSKKTGRTYRLPTQAEWLRAAAVAGIPAAAVQDYAWVSENATGTTHKVASKKADAAGLYDLYGNAAEWVTDPAGKPLIIGGSYRDAAAAVGPTKREADNPDWNASDPQFPKSVWWLADGGFIGLRVVTEDAAPAATPPAATPPAGSAPAPKPPASKPADAPKTGAPNA